MKRVRISCLISLISLAAAHCSKNSSEKNSYAEAKLAGLQTVTLAFKGDLAEEPREDRPYEFHIPKGTGLGPWNSKETMLILEQGQTLKIINDDSLYHMLHTEDEPCAHGEVMNQGESSLCLAETLYNPELKGPLYDHRFPETSAFWLKVIPSIKKTLIKNCTGCHGGSRPRAGLDLSIWPLKVRDLAELYGKFQYRLDPNAEAAIKMPKGATITEEERDALLTWAKANFFKPYESPDPQSRLLRYRIEQNQKLLASGEILSLPLSINFAADQGNLRVWVEEKFESTWFTLFDKALLPENFQTIDIPSEAELGDFRFPSNASIDEMVALAKNYRIRKVSSFIEALPHAYKVNYVLMRESASRHQADLEHPRLIMYSNSGKRFISASSHPSDPLRETIETAEAGIDGSWKFREISFQSSGITFNQDDSSCKSCHGQRPRPIWGSYPSWPGALADEGSEFSLEEFKAIKNLPSAASSRDRFALLIFDLREDPPSFFLPESHPIPYPNFKLNTVLASRMSAMLQQRLAKNPLALRIYANNLGNKECRGLWIKDEKADEAFRQSIDKMDYLMQYKAGDELKAEDWNQGAAHLLDIVFMRGLLELAKVDAGIRDIFKELLPLLEDYARHGSEEDEEARFNPKFADLRPKTYYYPTVLDAKDSSQYDEGLAGKTLQKKRQEFCDILHSFRLKP